MNQTVSTEVQTAAGLTDAYSVTLSIKNLDDESFLVPAGTIAAHDSLGVYSYEFTPEEGIPYLVTWTVLMEVSGESYVTTNYAGPYFVITKKSIRAVSDFKGQFRQGGVASFLLRITNFDGTPKNAEEITIEIYGPDGTEVVLDNSIPEQVTTGFYVYEWDIDADQGVGAYNAIWNMVTEGVEQSENQAINISADDDDIDTLIYSGKLLEIKYALENYLSCAQNIPVYFEQAKTTRDNKTFQFTFPRWNQVTGVKIYRNDIIVNDDIEVNYFNGTVIFDNTQTMYDVIHADYNFRWFTDEELVQFIGNALQDFNMYAPHSAYSLDHIGGVPDRFWPAVIYKAAVNAIRKLMLCLMFQEPQWVFGGPEGAKDIRSALETLKKNYEEDWYKLAENKKYGPYPSTMVISVPEYTLPGGRSRWFRYLFTSST